jgi:hypothetical protein
MGRILAYVKRAGPVIMAEEFTPQENKYDAREDHYRGF